MSARPAASVVVPSYQSAATIRACLRSLAAQDLAAPYEVIVVDSSRDGTAEIVANEFEDVMLVHRADQTEPAAARNLGLERARADVVAFLDADCVAPADWLRRLRQAVEHGCDGVGGGSRTATGTGS